MSRDPRIDAYIDKQAEFARPILAHIRDTLHEAGEIEESIKWSMPAFLYKGRPLANMAAFKAHAVMGFWQGQQLREGEAKNGAMGEFGRLTKVEDLPDRAALIGLIQTMGDIYTAQPRVGAGPAPTAAASNSYQDSPTQAFGIAHGVKCVATSEPSG